MPMEQVVHPDAVEADHRRSGAFGRIVRIDEGDLITVAHGTQGMEQVGRQDGGDTLQHVRGPQSSK